MKKIFIWLLVFFGGVLGTNLDFEVQAISGYQNYNYSGYKPFKKNNIAARIKANLQKKTHFRSPRPTYRKYRHQQNNSKNYHYSRYYRNRLSRENHNQNTNKTQAKSSKTSRKPFFYKNFAPQRFQNQRGASVLNRASRNSYWVDQQEERSALVRVIAEHQRKPIEQIDTAVHPLMQIRVGHSQSRNSLIFTPALEVLGMEFQIVDNERILTDLSNFEIVLDGESFPLDRAGRVVVKMNHQRIAAGEKKLLEVGIRVKNPDTMPRLRQSFRVKLRGVSVVEFGTSVPVPVVISGTTISENLTFSPLGNQENQGIASSSFRQIRGRILGAGETEDILGIKLRSALDDLIVKEITVRNTFGSNIDTLVYQVDLVDFGSEKVLDSTRFVNGGAHFKIRGNRVFVPRSGKIHLGFRVHIVSDIPNGNISRKIKLEIQPQDLEIWGYGSGRELPDSQKFVSFTSDTFSVAQTGGGDSAQAGISHSDNQPDLFPTGQLQTVYRFVIRNNTSEEISLGRVSANIFPTGVEFVGGGISSDFALKQMFNGRERNGNDFSAQYMGGNKVQFNALSEIYIAGHSTKEFALQVALRNVSGDNQVGIQMLGDTRLSSGSLSSVRASGANFIWSDHSGRPHVNGSTDWLSGYLFPGLPTNLWVNKND